MDTQEEMMEMEMEMEMVVDMHRETERGRSIEFEHRESKNGGLGFQFLIFITFNSEGQFCPRITPFRSGPEMGHQNSFLII